MSNNWKGMHNSIIQLIRFEKPDFEKLISWIDNEETLVQFAGTYFTFPLTIEQLDRYLQDQNRFVYKVIRVTTQTHIGHGEIYLEKNNAVLCRIIIGDPADRGSGIGLQVVNALLEIAFQKLAVEKVELNVFDWNIAAITCYTKAGFTINKENTKLREVNGKFWKALNMWIDKTTWKDLRF